MRTFVIKKMNARIFNKDGTANLDYPQWKRRVIVILAYIALRINTILALACIPLMFIALLGLKTLEMIKELWDATVETFAAQYRNQIRDTKGTIAIWKGEYGKGKLVIKNPNGKPTGIPG